MQVHGIESDRVEYGEGTYFDGSFRAISYPKDANPAMVRIGKWCSIADDVECLLGGEHHLDRRSTSPMGDPRYESFSKGDIVIGHDVWIGRGVRILSGVRIGTGAVVGAYSVVARDVEPYAIVVGNPARVVRFRFERDEVARFLASWE